VRIRMYIVLRIHVYANIRGVAVDRNNLRNGQESGVDARDFLVALC